MGRNIKDKRQRIPLSKYTKGGRISTLMAILAVACLLSAIAISIARRGQAGHEIGVFGATALILSMIGYVVGIKSFKDESRFLKYSWIGTIANIFVWIIMMSFIMIYI